MAKVARFLNLANVPLSQQKSEVMSKTADFICLPCPDLTATTYVNEVDIELPVLSVPIWVIIVFVDLSQVISNLRKM